MFKATLVAIIAAVCASCTMPPTQETQAVSAPTSGCTNDSGPTGCFEVNALLAQAAEAKADQAKADIEAQKRQEANQAAQAEEDRKWAKEQRLGAIALGIAQEACKSVSADEIVSAYNAHNFAYRGHSITFTSAGGAVADPRNGWVGDGTGASSPYGPTCSAFGQAETTDGTDLSVVAPLSFILSASGNHIAAVSIQP